MWEMVLWFSLIFSLTFWVVAYYTGCSLYCICFSLLIKIGKPAEAASVPTVDLTEMEAVKPPLPSLPQDTEVKNTPSLATGKSEIRNFLPFVVYSF